jgi:hypothetical protein
MTSNIAQDLKLESVDEQSVTQYLQQHPDLFDRHPQLLTRLRLQHPRNGTTVSLIERQVDVLREKHAALEQKLAEFLREDFDAYHTVLVLQVPKGTAGTLPGEVASPFMREVSTDNPIFKSFESLFSNARPRCGQVRDSQRDFLFGSEAAGIGSVALIPLNAMTPPGLLVLGSVDRDRFHPGMSVEFLSRMAELIADSLLRP